MEKCSSCSKENTHGLININRFIDKLDNLLKENKLTESLNHILYWKKEAIENGDERGLLTILNELVGLSRRLNDKPLATNAIDEILNLIDKLEINDLTSTATILINAATTLAHFNEFDNSIKLFNKAEDVFKNNHQENTYEYASLLNNKSCVLANNYEYSKSSNCILSAIKILEEIKHHDGDIALSYLNLAHVLYNDDSNCTDKVEELLDLAWEKINSSDIIHNGNYAYLLSKCVYSYKYFKRDVEALALEEVIKEIYGE